MDLLDSFVRITFDPDGAALVLLDYGTALWGPLEINGEQIVQEQGFVRAAGIKAFPRGNNRTALRFEKSEIEDSIVDAFATGLSAIVALPRTQADILVSLQDGRNWRISNAAIRAWPVGQEARLTRQAVEIIGGRLTADAGVFVPGQTWGEINYEWENLG